MGGGGRGRSFLPSRLPPLIDGPVDSGSASRGTNSWAVCWGLSWHPGCLGAGVRFTAGRPLPPLLSWPCVGLVFSCSGEICQISHHSFISFLTHILHAGAAARCVDYSFKETVTWDPFLASPLGGGERYRLVSVMIFRRPVYENSESSQIMLRTCGDLGGPIGTAWPSCTLIIVPHFHGLFAPHTYTSPSHHTAPPPPCYRQGDSQPVQKN
jgi:hypothetical protein